MRTITLLACFILGACSSAPDTTDAPASAAAESSSADTVGLIRVHFPDPDPGIPVYARVTPISNQFFHDNGWLAIVFYRSPSCVPTDFDLLGFYHFPGPDAAGAFACPLLVSGSYVIEDGAPLGTFPLIASATGEAVPIWFVRLDEFQAAVARGPLTIEQLTALPSRLAGTATVFNEMLQPRIGQHLVVIDAEGALEDGRRFLFHVTHVEDRTTSIGIAFR